MSTTRSSTRRLRELEAELTARDRAIVEMVARLGLVTGQQVVRVHWPEASEADLRAGRRTLQRLTQWRVLARLERRQGGLGRGSTSWTYALDTAGQRLVASEAGTAPRRPHLPRPAFWGHALLASEIYTRLAEATAGSDVQVAQWQGEPASWRRYGGAYGEQLLVKPDAFVEVDHPDFSDLFFVEVDTGSQSRTVIRTKIQSYQRLAASGVEQAAQGGVFPKVMVLTTTTQRQALLVDVLGELPAEAWSLFGVGLVTETARLLVSAAVGS